MCSQWCRVSRHHQSDSQTVPRVMYAVGTASPSSEFNTVQSVCFDCISPGFRRQGGMCATVIDCGCQLVSCSHFSSVFLKQAVLSWRSSDWFNPACTSTSFVVSCVFIYRVNQSPKETTVHILLPFMAVVESQCIYDCTETICAHGKARTCIWYDMIGLE